MTKTSFAKDSILNFLAAVLPIVITQFLIFPYLARVNLSDTYGFIVVVYSLFSFAPGALGNVLNNVRLIHNRDWSNEDNSDFNLLLVISGVISLGLSTPYIIASGFTDPIFLLLYAMTALMWMLREYGVVAFVADFDYRAVLINSLIMCVGYLIGFIFFCYGAHWAFTFFVGQLLSVVYIAKKSKIFVSGRKLTNRFRRTIKESGQLTCATLVGRASTYCDRLVLFPLIGGTGVAIYYAATLLAKIINMLSTAVNTVLLSRLSIKSASNKREFFTVLCMGLAVCTICYILINLLSSFILMELYPQFCDEALQIVPLTAATSLVAVLSSLASPYVLRFKSLSWQTIVPLISLIVYLVAAFLLLSEFGLIGFCTGALIAECLKLCVLILVFCLSHERAL